MRQNDLTGYVDAYNEHWQKAVKALGDPSKVHDINGWIGDLRHFAEKAHQEAVSAMDHGGKITSRDDDSDVWSRERVEDVFNTRLSNIAKLQQENSEVARKNDIPIRD